MNSMPMRHLIRGARSNSGAAGRRLQALVLGEDPLNQPSVTPPYDGILSTIDVNTDNYVISGIAEITFVASAVLMALTMLVVVICTLGRRCRRSHVTEDGDDEGPVVSLDYDDGDPVVIAFGKEKKKKKQQVVPK